MNAERESVVVVFVDLTLFLLVVAGDIVIETRMPYYVSICEKCEQESASVYIIRSPKNKTLYRLQSVGRVARLFIRAQQLIAGPPREKKGREDGRPSLMRFPMSPFFFRFRSLFPSTTHLFRAVNSQKRGADTSFFRLKDPPQRPLNNN